VATIWLTEAFVRGAALPADGSVLYRDAPDPSGKAGWTSGFALRVTAGGARAFVLSYRVRGTGQERRLTIGAWPTWSVIAARAEARELKMRIARGDDPLAELKAERGAPTVAELCDRFLDDHVARKRPNTRKQYGRIVEIIRRALGRKQVAAVEHADAVRLHRDIGRRAPVMANRTAAVLSKMMGMAVKAGMRPDNPARGIERNTEDHRERYLTGDELARLTRALADHRDQQAADILRLCMLTGCRRGEAQAARWDQFDLERGTWSKPATTTKQAKLHVAPLSAAALELLARIRRDGPFVFAGREPGTHRIEIRKNWAAICKAARIDGLRMHDLRHSFASELVSSGHSLPVVGALLGHAQITTTQRYAHLYDDVTRAAVNKVGARMAGLVGKRPAGQAKLKVVR
jgi:integrase